MVGQQGGQLPDLLGGEEVQPHDLQAAPHPQLVDRLPVRLVGRDDLPLERLRRPLPNSLRWPALDQRHVASCFGTGEIVKPVNGKAVGDPHDSPGYP